MSLSNRLRFASLVGIAVVVMSPGWLRAQSGASFPQFFIPVVFDPAASPLPNPTPTIIKEWGPLPDGRRWGSTAGVDIGPDGHVWAYDRCGDPGRPVPGGVLASPVGGCENSNVDPILKFDRHTGEVLTSFGAGLFVMPHGIHVDSDGNAWVTDMGGNEAGTKGHQVIKFSPEGEVLMRLGQAGVAGSGPDTFNRPCDVITAPNGDIFVGDGHDGQNDNPPPGTTGRIMKFTKDGEFIKEWGRVGSAPGEFRTPHALVFDSQGRLFVGDRGNHRIQIFDQDGNYIDSYYQFGRVSGLFITADDTLYAIDSESSIHRRAPNSQRGSTFRVHRWRTGVRIGKTTEDKVTAFIPPHFSDTKPLGVAGEGVAVDTDGNVYAAEGPGSLPAAGGGLTKYVKR